MDGADTTTMTTSGTTITRMNDKSGLGYNSTVIGGAPALTANAINGLPAISFNGSSYISGCNANTTATGTYFVIATLASGQGAGQQYTSAFVFGRSVGGGSACYNEIQSINLLACQNVATSLALSPQRNNANGPTYTLSNYNTAFMHTTVCNGTTMAGYGNGTSLGTTASSGNFAYTLYSIGSQTYSYASVFYNYNWTGYIGEAIAFNNALSDLQRQQVEGYLAQKWGLTAYLPPGHPGLTQTLYNGRVYQSRVPLALSFAVYYNNPTTFATGCQLWLDAADSTTVTGTTTVTAWRDKSGRGYNLTPGAGTTSYANSGITINSSYLYGAGAVNLTTFTFFIVAKNIGTSYNQPFFSARPNTTATFASTDGFGWYMDSGTQTRFFGRYPTTSEYITITGLNTLVTAVYSVTGTRDGLFTQWNSGTQVGTATYTTRTSTAQGFSVGGEWDGTTWYTYTNSGTIYEVIVYNTVLTTTQRQSVEGYLTKKWALAASLPAGNLGLTSTYVNPTWEATIPYGVNRSQPIVATGGTITYSGNFKIHTFTTVGNTNFQITQPSITQIQVLVVGGGGSGGACTGGGGGGGGAAFVGSQTISQGTYTVTVGAGGVPSAVDPYQGSNGGNSSFNSIIGIGGGTGGIYQGSFIYGAGSNGGCGGGACGPSSAVGLPLQSGGYAGGTAATGGPGGGGGGMGSVGSNATLPLGASSWVGGNGGNGGSYTIGGATYVVSGGGGGGSFNAGTGSAAGTGGTGGGGNGSISTVGGNATYYGGGGGGSCGGVQLPGGNGYQGVVIIAYNYL